MTQQPPIFSQDWFLNLTAETIIERVLWFILISVFFYIFRKYILRFTKRLAQHRRANEAEKAGEFQPDTAPSSFVMLGSFDADYTEGDLELRQTKYHFHIPFPEHLLSRVPRESDRETLLAGIRASQRKDEQLIQCTFTELGKEVGIPQLDQFINESALEIANEVIKPNSSINYISSTYGVSCIDIRHRDWKRNEAITGFITLYNTDYYTHRVMKKVYRRIEAANALGALPPLNVETYARPPQTDPKRLLLAMLNASFGLNVAVLFGNESINATPNLIFAQRGTGVYNEVKLKKQNIIYHISVNEGFDQSHVNLGVPTLLGCFQKGFVQEIGQVLGDAQVARSVDLAGATDTKQLADTQSSQATFYFRLLDCFLYVDEFELGIGACAYFPHLTRDVIEQIHRYSSDGAIESPKLHVMPYHYGKVETFLKQNRQRFKPHGLLVWEAFQYRMRLAGGQTGKMFEGQNPILFSWRK